MRSIVDIGASVPAFLGKLWKLVNDSETNHLISWSSGGKTFVIKNQADFARELLPLYYKHNNMASFIRQLNMYGFHKITSVENGGLRYEKDEIEFSHPCFMRGQAYLLEHIKRKIANSKALVATNDGDKVLVKPEMMTKVLSDVKTMKGKQENLDAKFSAMKSENEALWREVAILRQKHLKQQQIVNNLIRFLMSLVQPAPAHHHPRPANPTPGNSGVPGTKRPYQLMINDAAHNRTAVTPSKNVKLEKDARILEELIDDNLEDGPTIHELAHDDVLQTESSQSPLDPVNFITLDVSQANAKPQGNSNDAVVSSQYQVTLEDGEEIDVDAVPILQNNLMVTTPSPIVTSPTPMMASPTNFAVIDASNTIMSAPSTSKGLKNIKPAAGKIVSPSFQVIKPSADMKLPAEIFASDDSVSDAGAAVDDNIQDLLQEALAAAEVPTSKDQMVGGINIKIEKPETKKKSKKHKDNISDIKISNIKTEVQDDVDWSNMTLATVNNNIDLNRFQSMNRRQNMMKSLEDLSSQFGTNGSKDDIDDHLDAMQTDLESLRELLRGESYSLDTNTLFGLFGNDDPMYGLSYNAVEDRSKGSNNADESNNQLMTYTGNMPDFDFAQMSELEADNSQDCVSPAIIEGGSVLNTPQIVTTYSPKP